MRLKNTNCTATVKTGDHDDRKIELEVEESSIISMMLHVITINGIMTVTMSLITLSLLSTTSADFKHE